MRSIRKILYALFIVFIPFMVNAKSIDFSIKNVDVVDKSATAEVDNISFSNNTIESSIKLNELYDVVTYEIELKNNENVDYKIIGIKDNNEKDNIEISYNYDENIKKNDTFKMYVSIKYIKQVKNIDTTKINDLSIIINLEDENGKTSSIIINNPETIDGIVKYIILLIIAVIGIIMILKNKKSLLYAFLLILMVPLFVIGKENIELIINFNEIVLKGKYESYNVDVDNDNGSGVETLSFVYGSTIDEVNIPQKDGYEFIEWVDSNGDLVPGDTVITGDIFIKAKYKTIQYNILYELNGGEASNVNSYTVEDEITLNNPTKQGYVFAGWMEEGKEGLKTQLTINKGTTGDKKYIAVFSAREDTIYKVIHKKMDLNGSTYTTFETEELNGATDSTVKPQVKIYTGFTSPEEQEITINPDGSSEVTYLYKRNKYTLTILDSDYVLTETPSGKYYYETKITLKAKDRDSEKFDFKKWTNDSTKEEINITITEDIEIGPIYESRLLYHKVEALSPTEYVEKYTGEHKDSLTEAASKDIYYYTGDVKDKNNVKFADSCWKIIRTTDTGGVKIMYNGEPDSEGKCTDTRPKHDVVNASVSSAGLIGDFAFADSFTYDEDTKLFKLINAEVDNYSNNNNLIGKYTCKDSDVNATCSTLYQLHLTGESDGTLSSIAYKSGSANYSQIGTSPYSLSYYDSPGYIGYYNGLIRNMVSHVTKKDKNFISMENVLTNSSLNLNYWYADSISYANKKYSLVNPYKISSTDDYKNLVGKYTFRNTSETYTYSSVFYIAGVNNTNAVVKKIASGKYLDSYSPLVLGNSLVDNGDGTYTITDTENVELTEWYTNYKNFVGKYTCNGTSNTCKSPRYITETTNYSYRYVLASNKILIAKQRNGLELLDYITVRYDEIVKNPSSYSEYKYSCENTSHTCTNENLVMMVKYTNTGYSCTTNYLFGSSAKWNGTSYDILDTIDIEQINDPVSLSTHHYYCGTVGSTNCSKLRYVYLYYNSSIHYITINNQMEKIDDVLNAMLRNNAKESVLKKYIDNWYEKKLLNYNSYFEDTVFCNNRNYLDKSNTGWDDNGGNITKFLYFTEFNSHTTDLSCKNDTDKFSVSNPLAKLKYPVALETMSEYNLLNNQDSAKTGSAYWTLSPAIVNNVGSHINSITTNGTLTNTAASNSSGVRPVVSLIYGVESISGDGSMENPYIVKEN